MKASRNIRTILATAALLTAGTGLAHGSLDRLDPGTGPTSARGTSTLSATSRPQVRGEQYLTEFDDTTRRSGMHPSHSSASVLAADHEMRLEKRRAVLHRIENERRSVTVAMGG